MKWKREKEERQREMQQNDTCVQYVVVSSLHVLQQVLVDERDMAILGNFYEMIVGVWREGRVPQKWKDATF